MDVNQKSRTGIKILMEEESGRESSTVHLVATHI